MKVGFIGLGIMGKPMAKHLAAAGLELAVYDVNPAAVEALTAAGAKAAASPAEIGGSCGVIFLSLPNGDIVQQVLFGPDGVASAAQAGTIVCDTSSVTPGQSQACFQRLAEQGVAFVDAPVSGGEPGAIDGTLAFMAGGRQADFDALRPYFERMGASAVLVGDSGSGSVAKLANQVIVNLTIAAVGEAFVLSTKAGADPWKVFEAIRGGLAGSAVLEAKLPMMASRNFRAGGSITVNRKDIKNALDAGYQLDVPMPLSSQLFAIQQALKVEGRLGEDHSAYVKFFERLAGVEVRGEPREVQP